jgi:hypothetical protein
MNLRFRPNSPFQIQQGGGDDLGLGDRLLRLVASAGICTDDCRSQTLGEYGIAPLACF